MGRIIKNITMAKKLKAHVLSAFLCLLFVFVPAGSVHAAGTISGSLFSDVNSNGSDDGSSDPALTGVGIRIWSDTNNNNAIDIGSDTIVAGVLTNSSGAYSFSSQADGNYLVQAYDPMSLLGIGSFTTTHPIDTTIAGGNISNQQIGFHKTTTLQTDGTISSTLKIDENTANGPGSTSLNTDDRWAARSS